VSSVEDAIDPEGMQFVENTRVRPIRPSRPQVSMENDVPQVTSEEVPRNVPGDMELEGGRVFDEPEGMSSVSRRYGQVMDENRFSAPERPAPRPGQPVDEPRPATTQAAEAGETDAAVDASEDAAAEAGEAVGETAAETVGEAAGAAAAEGGLVAGALDFLGPVGVLAGIVTAGVELGKAFTKKEPPKPTPQPVAVRPTSFGRVRENIAPATNTAMTYQGGISAF
jgi:hypothetical protein